MSVKIILLALETLLLFLFLVPLPVICSGNLLGIIVSVMLMLITANWTKFCGIISKIWGHGAGKFGLIFVSTLILAGIIYVGILSILMYKAAENRSRKSQCYSWCLAVGKRRTPPHECYADDLTLQLWL